MAAMVMSVKKTFLCVEDEETSPLAVGCDGISTWPVFALRSADKPCRSGPASDAAEDETAASNSDDEVFTEEEASSLTSDYDAQGASLSALCGEQTCDPFSLRSDWRIAASASGPAAEAAYAPAFREPAFEPAYIPLPPRHAPALPREVMEPPAEAVPLPPAFAPLSEPRSLLLSGVLGSPPARAPAALASGSGWSRAEAAAATGRLCERRQPARPSARRFEDSASMGASETRTTVMMRNVPNDYTRQMLLDLLDSRGFAGQYDFFYLPMDFSTRSNIGYAFINFSSPGSAINFWQEFDGFSRWSLRSRKVCNLGWSDPCQGLDANVRRYRNSPVMCDSVPEDFKPMLFSSKGKQMRFPAPTRTLRPPRVAGA